MPSLSEDDIERIARGLSDLTLPKPEWTHAAHFAAALWLVRRHGARASVEMPPLIRAYNEATGVVNSGSSGYHETITLASLRAAQSWLRSRPGMALHSVLGNLMDSPLGRSGWPLEHWSRELLFSAAARRQWIEPDLKPLPF